MDLQCATSLQLMTGNFRFQYGFRFVLDFRVRPKFRFKTQPKAKMLHLNNCQHFHESRKKSFKNKNN